MLTGFLGRPSNINEMLPFGDTHTVAKHAAFERDALFDHGPHAKDRRLNVCTGVHTCVVHQQR